MSFFRFVGSCFLAAFFFSCSTENQTDSGKEALIVVDKMVRSYIITPKVFDGKNSLQYEIAYTFNYDKNGRITFVDGNHYLDVSKNWYRKHTRTTYTYDDLGRVIVLLCVDSQNGQVLNKLNLEYSNLGLLVRSFDEIKEEEFHYEYNTNKEVVLMKRKVKDKLSFVHLEYDGAGHLSRVYNPKHNQEKKNLNSSGGSNSNEILDFLYANLSYGIQLVPWIDTKSKVNFLNCDGQTWEIENLYTTDDRLPSAHEVRYRNEDVTLVHFYTLDYKKIRVKK